MTLLIVSDLHIGSRYFRHAEFAGFLAGLEPDCELILNGDTIHDAEAVLGPEHHAALDALKAESRKRRVVWIHGNHDRVYTLSDSAGFEFTDFLVLDNGTYVSHGAEFVPARVPLRLLCMLMSPFRIRIHGEYVLSARLAKSVPPLFSALERGMARNAARFARENGYRAIVCGHLHSAMSRTVDGIRYFNTGTWTEWPASYVVANGDRMELEWAG